MNCDQTRSLLMDVEAERSSVEVKEHLDRCAPCSEFSRRFDTAHEALRTHRAEHQPDAYFAHRVSAALPDNTELLGWAALRLLPATFALLLTLIVWAWLSTPGPTGLVETSPTDDLLAWVIEEDGS